jgi:signal transduction histidine kinase
VVDTVFALLLAIGSLPAAADMAGSDRGLAVSVPLTLLATLPVAVRRRWPVPVLAVTLTAALVLDVAYGRFQPLGPLLAFYTVAANVGRPTSVRVAAGTAVAFAATGIVTRERDVAFHVAVYAVFAAAWLLGDNLRTRRAYLATLEERAARLEREREEHARRAAAEEQARIARELHDILTHNVSVMTVQAAAAGDVFDRNPDRAREALASIESTGREALTELRRLLGKVERTDDERSLAPQPGLARLDGLLDQVRSTGLAVDLRVEGTPHALPAGVDVSAYRIVQEALTNTLKHAHATRASVLVRYDGDALGIGVADNGRGTAQTAPGEGRGLVGMRERAALLGGRLEAGPLAGGGFALQARLPLESSP